MESKGGTTKEPICGKYDQTLNKKNYFTETFRTDICRANLDFKD